MDTFLDNRLHETKYQDSISIHVLKCDGSANATIEFDHQIYLITPINNIQGFTRD